MDQFDNDFEEYINKLERRMWKCLGLTIIVAITVILIVGICYH